MNWISVEEMPLPLDDTYLGLFEGRHCLFCFWQEDECFWIAWQPGCYETFKVKKEEESKITHWMALPSPPNS